MVLYHGSSEIVETPLFGVGKTYNDYGSGFYMTEHAELAKEWACRERRPGFLNGYELDVTQLKTLDLSASEYSILHWLTLLIENRIFRISSPVMGHGKEWLIRHYHMDILPYDIIKGYRADDSYFAFARAFLNNTITVEQLELAMHLGRLGEQWVLKSKKAFSEIKFRGYEIVPGDIYYMKRKERDESARENYQQLLEETSDGSYLIDLIRKEK